MEGRVCENPECRKPATLQCPTCVKLQLEPSFFCSQDCFKALWGMHKLAHKKRDEKIESGFKFSGPLRPYPYSFTGHREIPDHVKKPDYFKRTEERRGGKEGGGTGRERGEEGEGRREEKEEPE